MMLIFLLISCRVVLALTEAGTAPDGMTIDSEDFLWVAVWGGQRIMRYLYIETS